MGRVYRDLPFRLSPEEEQDFRGCLFLAKKINVSINGEVVFDSTDTRGHLERLLAGREDYFYAEYLLGVWHRRHGNLEEAQSYFERACTHAPTVMVQCYQTPEGRAAPDLRIAGVRIECNRVEDGCLDPSLNLLYPEAITDAAGCVYFPCYKTVFRRSAMPHPKGCATNYPGLGWFEAPAKVTLLPIATVDLHSAQHAP